MIKLKKLLKEGLHGKFWWMDPRGKRIRVMKIDPSEGHRETALQILQSMGIQAEKDVFKQMAELGWTRLEYKGREGSYVIMYNPPINGLNSAQLKSLKALRDEEQEVVDRTPDIPWQEVTIRDSTKRVTSPVY